MFKIPSCSHRDEGRLPCFTWKGMPTSPAHLERRLVSTWHWKGTWGLCHNAKATDFPIHSRSDPISLHQFECQPRINAQHQRVLMPWFLIRKEHQVPNSTWLEAWNPFENSRKKQSSMPSHTSRPTSLFETAYTPRDPRQNMRGNLRFPPQL